MTFLELAAIITLITLVVYSANAACKHQRGAKRDMMRAMVLASVITLVIGTLLALASDADRYAAIRNFLLAGIIASGFAIGGAIRLTNRSLMYCDKRDCQMRSAPSKHAPLHLVWLHAMRRVVEFATGNHHANGSK